MHCVFFSSYPILVLSREPQEFLIRRSKGLPHILDCARTFSREEFSILRSSNVFSFIDSSILFPCFSLTRISSL